jgi:hypothetical protein
MQPSLWEFCRAHPIFGAGTLVGTIITVGTLLLDGWHLFHLGLPPQALEAFGVIILIGSVVGLLHRWWVVDLIPIKMLSPIPPTPRGERHQTGPKPMHESSANNSTTTKPLLIPQDIYLEANDSPELRYKRKLRIVLKNESSKYIQVMSANWRRRTGDDIEIKPQERLVWQVEEQPGSWENNKWKPGETAEITANPGSVVWVYIGLHDHATEHGVRRRLVQGRLGTLTIVMRADGQVTEQIISPGPIRI